MATSAAISRSSLYSQVFWDFFNLLNIRSNVADPLNASGGREDFVVAHEPNFSARNFNYPVVVVNPASTQIGDRRLADDVNAEVNGEIRISVLSTDVSKGNKSDYPKGKGLAFLDSISDDVAETLNSVTNRNTLRGYNIGMVKVERVSNDFVDKEDERIYVRDFTVTFRTGLLAVGS